MKSVPFGLAGFDALHHDGVFRADLVGRGGDVLGDVHRHLHAAFEELEELWRHG